MRIGILELLTSGIATSWKQEVEHYSTTKQYASVMPQAIAVWCRQLRHEVFYTTHYGHGDPKKLLPNDLDVVFITGITMSSAMSYGLAKLYRLEKTLTMIGAPTRKPFPTTAFGTSIWLFWSATSN